MVHIKKVLLVEDDESLRAVISDCLEDNDFTVTPAENGQEALEKLTKDRFDLILTDIQMPVMDGVALLKEVKATYLETPVIIMTGFSQALETKSAYNLGADGFLPKPFVFEDLFEVIDQIFSEQKASPPKEFEALSLETLVDEKSLPQAIYLKVSDGKFIKLTPEGESISKKDLQQALKSDENQFFIEKRDLKKVA